jgi:glycosyltransferase involved in cell wall biosynthesis
VTVVDEVTRPRLSVIVCTHRRPTELTHLISVLEDVWDDLDDELIVVDDTPTTEDVARLLDTTNLPVRRVVVHGPGLAAARNVGWAEAAGDVTVWFDDDCRPHPGTLAAYRSAFVHHRDPDLAAVGGPVRLAWPGGMPPRWFSESLAGYYSAIDAVNGSATYPFGTNMAIRRSWLEAVGGFDERLGRRGRSLASGEETQLFERIEAAGGRITWSHDAVVTHVVGPDRARLGWVAARALAQGRSDVRLDRIAGRGGSVRTGLSSAAAILTRGWGDLRRARSNDVLAPQVGRDLARRARRAGRVVEVVARRA